MTHTTRIHIAKLIAALAIAQAAGILGTLFTTPNIDTWYVHLVKPVLNPPNWLFAPVWTVLYTMMGVALYLAWTRHSGGHRRIAWIRLFLLHLCVNAGWSIIFFGRHALLPALTVITLLWCMLLALIILAYRFDVRISYLLTPYFAWVSFATYLNYSIWRLNPLS